MTVSEKCTEKMQALGERLRHMRLQRNETQRVFADRIGTSVPTLLKMESGDANIQLGFWLAALDILDRTADLDHLLAPPDDLFAKYEQTRKPRRQRASRRKAP